MAVSIAMTTRHGSTHWHMAAAYVHRDHLYMQANCIWGLLAAIASGSTHIIQFLCGIYAFEPYAVFNVVDDLALECMQANTKRSLTIFLSSQCIRLSALQRLLCKPTDGMISRGCKERRGTLILSERVERCQRTSIA